MTGLFAYINYRRKQKTELENQYRAKKLEIGENFYFINGELMTMMRKNIDYWNNLHNDRSEQTLNFMRREMEKLDVYQAQLHAENWKYNLIAIYYDVPFTAEEIQQANRRSHELYLRIVDLSNKIRVTIPQEQEDLYQVYSQTVFDLCAHYEHTYTRMQDNMTAIKGQLIGEFSTRTA